MKLWDWKMKFNATMGWLTRFKQWHGIHETTVLGCRNWGLVITNWNCNDWKSQKTMIVEGYQSKQHSFTLLWPPPAHRGEEICNAACIVYFCSKFFRLEWVLSILLKWKWIHIPTSVFLFKLLSILLTYFSVLIVIFWVAMLCNLCRQLLKPWRWKWCIPPKDW